MSSKLKKQKNICYVVLLCLLCSLNGYSQSDEDLIKLGLSLGGNSPLQSGFSNQYPGNGFNMPTVNLGVQYLFTETIGGKFDFGFSRLRGSEDDFKINYTRINLQAVYDFSEFLGLDSKSDFGFQAHAGPGFTFVRPLGGINNSDDNYFNTIIGAEMLYNLNRNASLFFDVSYIHGFTDLPDSAGIGAFNGSMLTVTIGVYLSLSGCYYCN